MVGLSRRDDEVAAREWASDLFSSGRGFQVVPEMREPSVIVEDGRDHTHVRNSEGAVALEWGAVRNGIVQVEIWGKPLRKNKNPSQWFCYLEKLEQIFLAREAWITCLAL